MQPIRHISSPTGTVPSGQTGLADRDMVPAAMSCLHRAFSSGRAMTLREILADKMLVVENGLPAWFVGRFRSLIIAACATGKSVSSTSRAANLPKSARLPRIQAAHALCWKYEASVRASRASSVPRPNTPPPQHFCLSGVSRPRHLRYPVTFSSYIRYRYALLLLPLSCIVAAD